MANRASLPHRLVLIHKRAALLRVTLEAGFVSTQKSEAARSEFLLNICRGALGGDPFVRFMAIAATHLALEHGMMIADRLRMDAYLEAIRRAVRPGSVVVDIGSGVGIFALAACRAGERRDWLETKKQLPALVRKGVPGGA